MNLTYFLILILICSPQLFLSGGMAQILWFAKLRAGLVGCTQVELLQDSARTTACALQCQSDCIAFQVLEKTKECNVCNRYHVLGLRVSDESFQYVAQTARILDVPLASVDETTPEQLDLPIVVGSMIFLSFTAMERGHFSANFFTPTGDLAMTLSFRMQYAGGQSNVLVYNHKIKSEWQNETRVPLPVVPGERSELYVLVTASEFDVAVDSGHSLPSFPHRLPIVPPWTIDVRGSVKIHEFSV